MDELPDDWYEDHEGQSLVLNSDKILVAINERDKRIAELEAELDEIKDEAWNAGCERNLME